MNESKTELMIIICYLGDRVDASSQKKLKEQKEAIENNGIEMKSYSAEWDAKVIQY